MISVLDSPEIRQSVFPISVEFYHEMGRLGFIGQDVELLEGILIAKISKSALHETLVDDLRLRLEKLAPAEMFVAKERPITCAKSEPEPDLALFAGHRNDFRRNHPTTAEIVIEVAISTQQKDRQKAVIYAAAGVKEYWLVEPDNEKISVYRSPTHRSYGECIVSEFGGIAKSNVLPGFEVDLAELFS